MTGLAGTGGAFGDWFGRSVAISGTTIIVGAWAYASGAGRAYVFTNSTGGWGQGSILKGCGQGINSVGRWLYREAPL